jgi:hypothetical protein
MEFDKKTIGLTPANRKVVEKIEEQNWFNERIDMARFALALALDNEIPPSKVENAETVWNVGSFDPDMEIRNVLQSLFPDYPPYRLAEFYLNSGLEIIGKRIEDDPYLDIKDIFIA